MLFQTKVNIPPANLQLAHTQKLLLMGSCFSEHIGNYLKQHKFPICLNPFGITFHPLAIAQQLTHLMQAKKWEGKDLLFHNELWLSLLHHSRFSHIDKAIALANIQKEQATGEKILAEADCLLLTFGTAWGYELKDSGQIVANCHKMPSNLFEKKLSNLAELHERYHVLFTQLFAFNPKLHIILTLSPVRHWKDGAVENQWAKATLSLLIRELQLQFPDKVSYFPSYEIVMDELRDYRFFEEDMLHPNAIAIKYIWQRFSETYFSAETQHLNGFLGKIRLAESHRPFFTETALHQAFLQQLTAQKKTVSEKYPFIFWD